MEVFAWGKHGNTMPADIYLTVEPNQNPPETGELLMENKDGQKGVKNIKLL